MHYENKPRFETLDKVDKKLEKFQKWMLSNGNIVFFSVCIMFVFVVGSIGYHIIMD